MPNYTTYPTAADVELLLKSASYWPEGDDSSPKVLYAREQATIAAAGAAREFENRTGWLPFLAKPAATTRLFDATSGDGVLEFGAGLLADPAPVFKLAQGDTVYGVDTSYWLQPANAPDQELPYTRLQSINSIFGGRVWSWPNRLSITGRWGYCATLPPDVWVAIQKKAGVEVLASIENLQSIASISQDGFSKAYDVVGIITQKDVLDRWGKDFDRFCTRYTRATC